MSEEIKLEAYCVKCREKRILDNPKAEWAANGSPATRGQCPVCGTNMYRRGHTTAHETLPKPEITSRPKKKRKGTSKGRSKKKAVRRSGNLVIVESAETSDAAIRLCQVLAM